jgi:hypothetical protein
MSFIPSMYHVSITLLNPRLIIDIVSVCFDVSWLWRKKDMDLYESVKKYFSDQSKSPFGGSPWNCWSMKFICADSSYVRTQIMCNELVVKMPYTSSIKLIRPKKMANNWKSDFFRSPITLKPWTSFFRSCVYMRECITPTIESDWRSITFVLLCRVKLFLTDMVGICDLVIRLVWHYAQG